MRVGSAGKTFSLTGWKVGYITCDRSLAPNVAKAHQNLTFTTAPNLQRGVAVGLAKDDAYFHGLSTSLQAKRDRLAANVAKAHQNLTFTTAPNLQRGVAVGLMKDDSYFHGLSTSLQAKRDRLAAGLKKLGFGVLDSKGSYFITTDFRPLGFNGDDVAFCRTLTTEAKVTAIPVTAFYADRADSDDEGPDAPSHYARFAFCKADHLLDEALERMRVWLEARGQLTAAVGRG